MKFGKRSGRLLTGAVASVVFCVGTGSALAAPSPRATVPKGHSVVATRLKSQPLQGAAERAHALLERGDRAGALREFESALVGSPGNARLWQVVGDLRFALDRAPEALTAWERASALAPWDDTLAERVARGAVKLGDYERAAAAQLRVVDLLAERAQGDGSKTRKDLGSGRQVSLAETFRSHLGILSELAVLAGDFTTGEQAARRLIHFAPEAIDGRLALAYVHLHAAEFDDAADLYEEVLRVAPDNGTALNNLGNIHYMRGDFDAAAGNFERILETGSASVYSQSIATANLGELMQLQRAFKDARSMYQEAIELQPHGAWGYMGMAALLDITGKYDEAVDRMIDGWERDQNRLTRLNMHFYKDEWTWQRDALIAEIEGDLPLAEKLWRQIQAGNVEMLKKSAAWHLRSLTLTER